MVREQDYNLVNYGNFNKLTKIDLNYYYQSLAVSNVATTHTYCFSQVSLIETNLGEHLDGTRKYWDELHKIAVDSGIETEMKSEIDIELGSGIKLGNWNEKGLISNN